MVLIGGGGHAVVVGEAALLAGATIIGFLDDNPGAALASRPIRLPHPYATPRHLGGLDALRVLTGHEWIIALGDLSRRAATLERLSAESLTGAPTRGPVCVVHPAAVLSPTALVEPGTFLGPGAIVHARARVGAHGIINSGAIIEHDCVLETNVHIAPGAVLGGAVHVGAGTLVGLGARVLPGVRIGAGCTIGAGAVVTRDLPPGTRAVGVPARG